MDLFVEESKKDTFGRETVTHNVDRKTAKGNENDKGRCIVTLRQKPSLSFQIFRLLLCFEIRNTNLSLLFVTEWPKIKLEEYS